MALFERLTRFWIECKRVLIVTKKPSAAEYKTIVKVAGLGLILIGLIGFIVMIISTAIKSIAI